MAGIELDELIRYQPLVKEASLRSTIVNSIGLVNRIGEHGIGVTILVLKLVMESSCSDRPKWRRRRHF